MYFLISLIFFFIFFLSFKKFKKTMSKKNQKLLKFKKKLISKESKIEKIFFRQDEKTTLDPNINIQININDNEDNTIRKINIHRARLAKHKKSKLNGETLFVDSEKNIYKFVDGKKIIID